MNRIVNLLYGHKELQYAEFEKWVDGALSVDLPDEIVAFCFNLYDDGDGNWSVEIVGAGSFDKDNSDWACDEVFTNRKNPLRWKSKMSREMVLSSFESLLESYLWHGKYSSLLLEKQGLGFGFVDGDLALIFPKETVVPDELVKHYPAPPEKLRTIIQRVPGTGIFLYQYIKGFNISKEAKYWAMDMMENGLETPGIIQLAGEDLNMNYLTYSDLLDTIFRELDIDVQPETAYLAYAVNVATEVLRGDRTAKSGFELLSRAEIDSDYNKIFWDFYYWFYEADMAIKDSGLRKDNVEEWMHQYFEKFVKANKMYRSISS